MSFITPDKNNVNPYYNFYYPQVNSVNLKSSIDTNLSEKYINSYVMPSSSQNLEKPSNLVEKVKNHPVYHDYLNQTDAPVCSQDSLTRILSTSSSDMSISSLTDKNTRTIDDSYSSNKLKMKKVREDTFNIPQACLPTNRFAKMKLNINNLKRGRGLHDFMADNLPVVDQLWEREIVPSKYAISSSPNQEQGSLLPNSNFKAISTQNQEIIPPHHSLEERIVISDDSSNGSNSDSLNSSHGNSFRVCRNSGIGNVIQFIHDKSKSQSFIFQDSYTEIEKIISKKQCNHRKRSPSSSSKESFKSSGDRKKYKISKISETLDHRGNRESSPRVESSRRKSTERNRHRSPKYLKKRSHRETEESHSRGDRERSKNSSRKSERRSDRENRKSSPSLESFKRHSPERNRHRSPKISRTLDYPKNRESSTRVESSRRKSTERNRHRSIKNSEKHGHHETEESYSRVEREQSRHKSPELSEELGHHENRNSSSSIDSFTRNSPELIPITTPIISETLTYRELKKSPPPSSESAINHDFVQPDLHSDLMNVANSHLSEVPNVISNIKQEPKDEVTIKSEPIYFSEFESVQLDDDNKKCAYLLNNTITVLKIYKMSFNEDQPYSEFLELCKYFHITEIDFVPYPSCLIWERNLKRFLAVMVHRKVGDSNTEPFVQIDVSVEDYVKVVQKMVLPQII